MDAWTTPDPTAATATELAGRVEVVVVTTLGEWAQVRGENGWEGWVDGRLLEQLDPAGAAGDQRAYILLGIAVAVLIVLAVIGLVGS
jgi:SH3-like domain-containing protein